MRRRVKRAVKTVIVAVITVAAIASVPPSTWREAEDVLRWHVRSIEAMARPAAERSADWFERQKHALRVRLGGIEMGAGNAAEVRKVESVRIAGSSGAFTGPARMIDGDTLDVGGVRIRLHGIDAPESEQSCQAGGKRWSCGREPMLPARGRAPRVPAMTSLVSWCEIGVGEEADAASDCTDLAVTSEAAPRSAPAYGSECSIAR